MFMDLYRRLFRKALENYCKKLPVAFYILHGRHMPHLKFFSDNNSLTIYVRVHNFELKLGL